MVPSASDFDFNFCDIAMYKFHFLNSDTKRRGFVIKRLGYLVTDFKSAAKALVWTLRWFFGTGLQVVLKLKDEKEQFVSRPFILRQNHLKMARGRERETQRERERRVTERGGVGCGESWVMEVNIYSTNAGFTLYPQGN